MKQVITEEMKIHEEWYKEAADMTMEKLPEFLRHLTEDYQHDYGTICHALSAGAVATAWAMDKTPCAGITGFQAGFVMWGFIQHWQYPHNCCGLRLLDMDNLLYPQYEDKFHTISRDTWEKVQKEAAERIAESRRQHENYLLKMEQYKKEMEQFLVNVKQFELQHPEYPKYEDNPEFYQHLGAGTVEQHEEYQKKVESGFLFEPRKPYDTSAHAAVMQHWKDIVDGKIPFGLRLED
ncbi:MAG: hypothetical protein Q4F83_10950 [Eubacteriales bacterium]|nr:hypothetical protein [Eubacteriales bacterium]